MPESGTCEGCGHVSTHTGMDCIYSTPHGALCPDCMYEHMRNPWIPVSDGTPRKHGFYSDKVLIVVDYRKQGGGRQVRTANYGPRGWVGEIDETVTHWMKMPEPPGD